MIITIQFQNSSSDQKINFINRRDDIFLKFQFHLFQYNLYFLFENAKLLNFIFILFVENIVGRIVFFDVSHEFHVELVAETFHQIPAGNELLEKRFWQFKILGLFCKVFERWEFYFWRFSRNVEKLLRLLRK